MTAASASAVRGPVATNTYSSPETSGTVSYSLPITVTFGSALIFSVTYAANFSRSTASAPPAGTLDAAAASIVSEPRIRISSFKRPQAFAYTSLLLSEFEHTSSLSRGLSCAGVYFFGFMSAKVTFTPRFAR